MTDPKKLVENWLEEESARPSALQEAPPPPPDRTYDVRLAAWVDILGMRKKMLEEKKAEEIFRCMEQLLTYVKNACDDLVLQGKIRYLQISDGFILVADLDLVNTLCEILCRIQWNVLVYTNMLVRGALTAGNVSMSDDIIIGPGFIEAYKLESETAIFPRIIFANEIMEYIPKNKICFDYLKKDSDNFMYLDFVKFMVESDKLNRQTLNLLLQTRKVKEVIAKEYEKNIRADKRTAQKYGWTISKLNDHGVDLKIK